MVIKFDADERENSECQDKIVTVYIALAYVARGSRCIINFRLVTFIPSHMVHVKTRKFISLFCDHKERRNSLIEVRVKCLVLSQVLIVRAARMPENNK